LATEKETDDSDLEVGGIIVVCEKFKKERKVE
jgi:hypothetical protein